MLPTEQHGLWLYRTARLPPSEEHQRWHRGEYYRARRRHRASRRYRVRRRAAAVLRGLADRVEAARADAGEHSSSGIARTGG